LFPFFLEKTSIIDFHEWKVSRAMFWKICCGQKQIKINDQCPPLVENEWKIDVRNFLDILRRKQRIKGTFARNLLSLNALKAQKRSNLFPKNKAEREKENLPFFLVSTQIYVSLIECDLPRKTNTAENRTSNIWRGTMFVISQEIFQFPSGKCLVLGKLS
jgi:hypothetical protein